MTVAVRLGHPARDLEACLAEHHGAHAPQPSGGCLARVATNRQVAYTRALF